MVVWLFPAAKETPVVEPEPDEENCSAEATEDEPPPPPPQAERNRIGKIIKINNFIKLLVY